MPGTRTRSATHWEGVLADSNGPSAGCHSTTLACTRHKPQTPFAQQCVAVARGGRRGRPWTPPNPSRAMPTCHGRLIHMERCGVRGGALGVKPEGGWMDDRHGAQEGGPLVPPERVFLVQGGAPAAKGKKRKELVSHGGNSAIEIRRRVRPRTGA
jgi:hypothetical protein